MSVPIYTVSKFVALVLGANPWNHGEWFIQDITVLRVPHSLEAESLVSLTTLFNKQTHQTFFVIRH